MKKLIAFLLTAILAVLIIGIVLIVNDDFEQDLSFYLNVQLYNLFFVEDLEVATDELSDYYTEIGHYLEDKNYSIEDIEFNKHYEDTQILIEDLQMRLATVELDNEDVIEINALLIEALNSMEAGSVILFNAYTNRNIDEFEIAGEQLNQAYDYVDYWYSSITD